MEYTTVVNKVELVAGHVLFKDWHKVMVRIYTLHGMVIDYGHNYEAWNATDGKSVRVRVERCKRTNVHAWAHLV